MVYGEPPPAASAVVDGAVVAIDKPLPRIPHAVLALWLLRAVVFAASAAVAGVALAGPPGFAVFARIGCIVGALQLLTLLRVSTKTRFGVHRECYLQIDRVAQPRFFALFDDVCEHIGVAPCERVFLTSAANAMNERIEGSSALCFGWPLLSHSTVSEFLTTVGHETAHHAADDLGDSERLANGELHQLCSTRSFVFRRLAARLVRWSTPDTNRRSRIAEHAADFWGAAVGGAGHTASSLWRDTRTVHLWGLVCDDIGVVERAGFRPDNLFPLLRTAWLMAEDLDYFAAEPIEVDDVESTHPGFHERSRRAEDGIKGLPPRNDDLRPATALFDDPEALERELTNLMYARTKLKVLERDALWAVFAHSLGDDVRRRFAEALRCEIGPEHDAEALLRLARLHLHVIHRSPDGFELLNAAVDLALVEGSLPGTRVLGSPGAVSFGGAPIAVGSVVVGLMKDAGWWQDLLAAFHRPTCVPTTRQDETIDERDESADFDEDTEPMLLAEAA